MLNTCLLKRFMVSVLGTLSLCVGIANSLDVESVLPNNTKKLPPKTFSFLYGKLQALKNLVRGCYNIDSPKKLALFKEILKRELKFANKDYTLFYHANRDSALIMQEFFKALYSKLESKIVPNDFEFLRFYKMKSVHLSAQKWIETQNEIYDSTEPQRSLLLSTNVALFGNAGKSHSGESTLQFFHENSNIAPPTFNSMVEKTLAAIGRKHLAKDIEFQLRNILKMAQGFPSIMQIAIPNKLVDTVAYLSKPYGIPLDAVEQPILKATCKKNRITRTLEAIKIISEQASKLPTHFIDSVQARILIQEKYMLNPFSGIKIIRHTLLPKKTLSKIKAGVVNIVDSFIAV